MYISNSRISQKNRLIKTIIFIVVLLTSFQVVAKEQFDIFLLSLEELMQVNITGATLTTENLKTIPAAVSGFIIVLSA